MEILQIGSSAVSGNAIIAHAFSFKIIRAIDPPAIQHTDMHSIYRTAERTAHAPGTALAENGASALKGDVSHRTITRTFSALDALV